jgi:hypothetical protein
MAVCSAMRRDDRHIMRGIKQTVNSLIHEQLLFHQSRSLFQGEGGQLDPSFL